MDLTPADSSHMTFEPPQHYEPAQGYQSPLPPTYQPAHGYTGQPPYLPPPGYTAPPASTPAPKRKLSVLVTAIVAVVALGAGVAIGHFTTGSSNKSHSALVAHSSSPAPSSASAASSATLKTIAVSGTMTLVDDTGFTGTSTCEGTGGYSDIAAGAEVVVADDSGKTLAITDLTDGTVTAEGCEFFFTTTVPAGLGFYSVTVTHRGIIKYSEADIASPSLTLGN
jgi:hypothetical protein